MIDISLSLSEHHITFSPSIDLIVIYMTITRIPKNINKFRDIIYVILRKI